MRRATGEGGQDEHLASPAEQLALLAAKGCGCVTSPD
jgi:hypothetical protein